MGQAQKEGEKGTQGSLGEGKRACLRLCCFSGERQQEHLLRLAACLLWIQLGVLITLLEYLDLIPNGSSQLCSS